MATKRMMTRLLAAALVALALVPAVAATALADGVVTIGKVQYTLNDMDVGGGVTVSWCDPAISGDVAILETVQGRTVTAIGERAFYHCSDLGSVEIPASVTSIGMSAFEDCTSLSSVGFARGSKLETIGVWAFGDCPKLGSIAIPASVREIGQYAFKGTGLKDVALPEGLEEINVCLFQNCAGLTRVYIPSSVTAIGGFAFSGCGKLSTIDFGGSESQWRAISGHGKPDIEPASFGAPDIASSAPASIEGAKVALSATSFTYNGKVRKPAVRTVGGKALAAGTDYKVRIRDGAGKAVKSPKAAGAYTVVVTGKGGYTGTAKATYKIKKAANTLSAKAKSKKAVAVRAGKSLKAERLFKVSGAKGKVAYKKAKGSKKIAVAKNGKVSVKKRCKKGTYALTVKVRAKGTANYKASKWKAVKVKVRVK